MGTLSGCYVYGGGDYGCGMIIMIVVMFVMLVLSNGDYCTGGGVGIGRILTKIILSEASYKINLE